MFTCTLVLHIHCRIYTYLVVFTTICLEHTPLVFRGVVIIFDGNVCVVCPILLVRCFVRIVYPAFGDEMLVLSDACTFVIPPDLIRLRLPWLFFKDPGDPPVAVCTVPLSLPPLRKQKSMFVDGTLIVQVGKTLRKYITASTLVVTVIYIAVAD